MKNLSLFKIIVFYANPGINILEIVFLLFSAILIYFAIRFYLKRPQNTDLNYQALFNGSPLPMYVMAKSTLKILAVNDAMTKLYGYTSNEFLTMTAFDIRPQEERKRISDFLIEYGELINDSGVWLHKKKNGDCFYAQITFHSVPFTKQDAYMVMVVDIDKSITDEKRINDLVHLYETVNKATNDVIWDYDLVKDKLNWMQGYKEIYGYDKESSQNSFWAMKKIHPDDRSRVQLAFKVVLDQKSKDWFAEYRYLCADGTIKYVRDRGYVIFDLNGEPVRMIGALQDIDKQKKYEQQLLSQNEQLKEIAWINSHEVRRPLSNILGLISLIKDSSNKPEDVLQLIDLLSLSSEELDKAVIMVNRQTMKATSDRPSDSAII